jgi:transposase
MPDIESLLGEIAALRGMVAERDARLAELASIDVQLKTARLEIEHLHLQIASLRRQRYGRSSEKLDRDIAQLEMRLEDLEENLGEQVATHAKQRGQEPDEESAAKPRRKPAGRRPLPAHLPREVVVHEPKITCNCGNCDPARLVKLGETTTEVLDPASEMEIVQVVELLS